ncbi:MAG: hypothetical protein ACRERV_01460 [Methylococcales bacterium]
MDTIRVDICYRPLRIGWAIRAGDMNSFRQAVKYSYAFWGGRFNPILIIDNEAKVERLVDLFRIDFIVPLGTSDEVNEFPKSYLHLINPFFHNPLFFPDANNPRCQVLDIHNALIYLRDRSEWKHLKEKGVRLYSWSPDDPLADVFLMQFGMYPSIDDTGLDYRYMVMQAAEAEEIFLVKDAPIPASELDYPSIPYLSRQALHRHYSIREGSGSPGFFVGDATNLDDLVCHWNLRAADIPLWFVDPNYLERYANVIPAWDSRMRERVSQWHEFNRHDVAVWLRQDNLDQKRLEECRPFGDLQLMVSTVSIDSWNGLNILPPMMCFDQVSTLGVLGRDNGKPKVSFSLNGKPFCDDTWFHSQHLVASISFVGGLYGDDLHTFRPPYVPELNEFYARTMHLEYNKLRIESERVGLIIDAADTDSFLHALPVADMMERLFGMANYAAKPSSAGLITRQLIARLGGLQGSRVFKIPGVRRLLKAHGLMVSFTKRSAIQLIGKKDPDNPHAKFEDHEDLYIEPRPRGTKLNPVDVFSHLVEKGLFRIGAKLTCPICRMASWIALDTLKQRVICDLCGNDYDATRQLVNGECHYRRSGVLGAEKNAQGAVPVVLTLQQLDTNFHRAFCDPLYSPSLDLDPKDGINLPKCETDFVWVIARPYPRRTVIILGECKDKGPIDATGIDILRSVADSFPRNRFETFVLLVKLSPFIPEEINHAKVLNDKYRTRAILLTARELEPYHIYERTKAEFDIERYGGTPEDLARATVKIYFAEESSTR